jgi:predicted transcriptional regulator
MLVKIPVVLGTLIIHSKEVERINILTKLILHAIALGVNINRIPYVTNLPQRLVLENIEELERRGVIIRNYNGNYILTDVGRKNFNLLNETEIINERKIEVLVDSYTKHIFRKEEILERYVSDEEKEKIKEVVKIEGNRYIKQFLNNLDPSNSKEIASKILKNIEEEDMENISVEVKMVKEKGGYIVGKVKNNIVKKNQKSKMGSDIVIKREIFKNIYVPKFNSLKKIDKKVIDALVTLEKNGFQYISDSGLEILQKYQISKENLVYYYDPKDNKLSVNKFKSDIKESEIKSMAVLPISDKNQNIDINEIEEIQELKAKYGNDIEFEVKVEKEYVYEKFAIEDVIDIYDKEVEINE